MDFLKKAISYRAMHQKSTPPGIHPIEGTDQMVMYNSKCMLVLGYTLEQAQILLRELAEENRDNVVRCSKDRILFKDGYLFVARSVSDPKSIVGLMFSQVMAPPLCMSEMVRATLDCMMDRFFIPEEFRWITVSL